VKLKRPEKYRMAFNLKEGMEVRDKEGNWLTLTSVLNVTSPAKFVHVTFAGGGSDAFRTQDQVMSR
jgi:hypothetical protein